MKSNPNEISPQGSLNDRAEDIDGNNLKEGLLIIDKVPFYIVDFFYVDKAIPMVAVFGIEKNSKDDYIAGYNTDINSLSKDYEIKTLMNKNYNFSTDLSSEIKKKKHLSETEKAGRKKEYKEPLFYGAVGEGTSTITGQYTQLGFFDKSTKGNSTGVFIALDDLTWFSDNRELLIMLKSLTKGGEDYINSYLSSANMGSVTMPDINEGNIDLSNELKY